MSASKGICLGFPDLSPEKVVDLLPDKFGFDFSGHWHDEIGTYFAWFEPPDAYGISDRAIPIMPTRYSGEDGEYVAGGGTWEPDECGQDFIGAGSWTDPGGIGKVLPQAKVTEV